MRLFIAILLSEEMKKALCDLQDDMIRQGIRGHFTGEDNLHMTLAFIGEYDPQDVLDVMECVPYEGGTLTLSGYGNFGRLLYASLEAEESVRDYVRDLRKALRSAGIPYDTKDFLPHVTLARNIAKGLPALTVPSVTMHADRISLMKSERTKDGMIYTEIASIT